MKPVCVLGNGQLGRMLRQAAEPLGIQVYPVGIDAEPESLPIAQSVITAEVERWPETALTRELANHPAFVNRDIFPRLADRFDAETAARPAQSGDSAVAVTGR
jgi:phosphoribosylaminoimidazole carboxylase (EC 4.1.1.21)